MEDFTPPQACLVLPLPLPLGGGGEHDQAMIPRTMAF